MKLKIIIVLFFSMVTIFISCSSPEVFSEQDKIFHGGSSTGGIGSLYFALYKNNRYQVCNSGGIGEDCYSGNFELKNDTIILLNLDKQVPLKFNRLIILRYNKQDSSFWKMKYSNNHFPWQDLKQNDSMLGGSGDIYQLDNRNKIVWDKKQNHFIIRMDSLAKR